MLSKIKPVSFTIFKSVTTFVKLTSLHHKARRVQKRHCEQNHVDYEFISCKKHQKNVIRLCGNYAIR